MANSPEVHTNSGETNDFEHAWLTCLLFFAQFYDYHPLFDHLSLEFKAKPSALPPEVEA